MPSLYIHIRWLYPLRIENLEPAIYPSQPPFGDQLGDVCQHGCLAQLEGHCDRPR